MRLRIQECSVPVCATLLLLIVTSACQSAEPAATVTLRTVTPKQYAAILKSAKGKVVLVDFWATYCRPCRQQFPHTVELHNKLADQGLVVLSMSCDDEENHEAALKFLTKSQARFTNLRSAPGASDETFNAYDIDSGALPHYKLYDRKGKLRQTFALDPAAKKQFTSEDVQAKVEELLGEK